MTNDDLLIPMIEKINALERRLAEMESRERAVGNMLKSVYDANNNGIVDAAESVPWAGVTGKPQHLNVVVSTTALTVGTHVFTRATHFPSVPVGARAVELNVLGRWSTPASATTRATVTGDGGKYMLLTNKYQWGYESGWAKVYLDDGKFTVTVEGEDMNSTAITIRGYEM